MRTLARAAVTSLRVQSAGLGLVVVLVAVLGVLGTHASARLGNNIADDELTTSTATGQLAWDMDTAYDTGEEAFLAAGADQQGRLLYSLYTTILPAADTQLAYVQRLHAGGARHLRQRRCGDEDK